MLPVEVVVAAGEVDVAVVLAAETRPNDETNAIRRLGRNMVGSVEACCAGSLRRYGGKRVWWGGGKNECGEKELLEKWAGNGVRVAADGRGRAQNGFR